MTLRQLPRVEIGARPGVRSDISQSVLARWSPDIRAASSDEATISVLDVIGYDYWEEGVTAKRVAGALRAIGDRPVVVNVNSPGGDMFEGLAIYNLLRDHPQKVTVRVLGIAASAASVIAMAGDEVQIGRGAFLMIHNSWVIAGGNRHDMREVADWLEPFDEAMADIYAARTGLDAKKIAGLMDAETYLSAKASIDQGFADDYMPADQVTVDGGDANALLLRAERRLDLMAQRAGISRVDARQIAAELKSGGKRGAAPTGAPGAADIVAGLQEIRDLLKS